MKRDEVKPDRSMHQIDRDIDARERKKVQAKAQKYAVDWRAIDGVPSDYKEVFNTKAEAVAFLWGLEEGGVAEIGKVRKV